MGVKYHEKGDYMKSQTLMEELMTVYRGTSKGEIVHYYYALSTYNLGDFILASFHFRNFVKSYPQSKHAEECAYMNAYCYFLMSPNYTLDQTDTKSAITEFQQFINSYPHSSRVATCNEMIDKLRIKLEKKSYEISKQYFLISDYKAAIVAMNNFHKDFPASRYLEELAYVNVKANFQLALNSIEAKKKERLDATIQAYYKFIDGYPKSSWVKPAESIFEQVQKIKSTTATKS